MIGGAMFTTIMTLWKQHKNKQLIAELTGHDWKTVAKTIKMGEAGIEYPAKKPHPRILDQYKEQLIEWMEKDGLNGLKTFERLQSMGVKVGYSTVKDYLAAIKKRDNIFVRIETKPGEEAQVDFGYIGLTVDHQERKRKTWVFNMRLSYSRLDYYEKVYNQRVETFIQCHINAFRYFGGIPEYVKIDNLKAAILEANFYAPIFQQLYQNFAEYYGFKPAPCRVRRPNDKGKVESGIKYFKSNFMLGRKFEDARDFDQQLKHWLDHVCNQRVHGTIRRIPREVFDMEEKSRLKPLPLVEFKLSTVGSRKVYHDCHIYFEYNYYSVPFEYVGKEVDVEMNHNLLKIFYQGKEIAVHPVQAGRGKFCTNQNHYPAYKRFSETEYQEKYQAQMAGIGPFAEQLFFAVVEDHPKDWSRSIKGILSLLKDYPKEIVDSACKRALAFNACQFLVIKNICGNGSYNLPVEFNFEEGKTHEYAEV